MAISTARLAELRKDARLSSEASCIIEMLLVESLPPLEAKVYHHIMMYGDAQTPATARDIATKFSLTIHHASTLLKRLHNWGLLQRELMTTENGHEYEYR